MSPVALHRPLARDARRAGNARLASKRPCQLPELRQSFSIEPRRAAWHRRCSTTVLRTKGGFSMLAPRKRVGRAAWLVTTVAATCAPLALAASAWAEEAPKIDS